MTQTLILPGVLRPTTIARQLTLIDTTLGYANVIAKGYLAAQQALGHTFFSTDLIYIQYLNGANYFAPVFDVNGNITLYPALGAVVSNTYVCGEAALASAGTVLLQPSTGTMQFTVSDIRLIYSASGLSGNSGNRLLSVTDGTNSFNSTGITAALLGTPVNTIFGASGNPLAGALSQNTPSVAGANIVAQYAGGSTDYNAGSVTIQVTVRRVA